MSTINKECKTNHFFVKLLLSVMETLADTTFLEIMTADPLNS